MRPLALHRDSHGHATSGTDRRTVVVAILRFRLSHADKRSPRPAARGGPPPDGVTCTGMSTSIDGGSRAVALLADDDDWFATPQRQRVEQEALPWDGELEWQLREPESRRSRPAPGCARASGGRRRLPRVRRHPHRPGHEASGHEGRDGTRCDSGTRHLVRGNRRQLRHIRHVGSGRRHRLVERRHRNAEYRHRNAEHEHRYPEHDG